MASKDDDEDNTDLGLYALVSVLVALPLAAWKGWVLVKLWAWFVLPLGAPMINMWHAAGLAMLLSWLADSSAAYSTAMQKTNTHSPKMRFWVMTLLGVFVPLLMWAYGAIYHSFMQ
jgi:hypothetical protein